jgi:hypothetical protein
MNLKRIAGIINLIAAVVFIGLGVSAQPRRTAFIVIGVVFLLIGILRLKQAPPGPPTS